MRTRLAAGALALLGMLGPLPASAADSLSNPGTVITPIQAEAVVSAIWSSREDALARRDRAAVEALEGGSALEYDLAWLDGIVPSRPGGDTARLLYEQLVLVPAEDRYPVSFFAIVGFEDPSDHRVRSDVWTEVMVLTKAGDSTPWRVTLEALTWDPVWTLAGKLGIAAGESYAPPSMDAVPVDPNQVRHRHTPLDGWVREATSPVSTYSAGLNGGALLVCVSQDFRQVRNRPWWRPEHVRANDARLIPDGYYRAIDTRRVDEDCVVAPPAGDPAARIQDVATRSTITAHTVLPAAQPPWLLIGVAGLLGLAGLGRILLWLKPGHPPRRPIRPVSWNEIERDTAFHGATLILMWALILVEVERWVLTVWWPLALLLAAVPTLWFLLMLPSPLRTVTVTVRAIVNRPPEEMFSLIADPRNHRQWDDQLEKVEAVHDGPLGVGQRFHARQRLPDGRRAESETEIVEYEPGRRVTIQTVGFWHPQRFAWSFEPTEGGKTRLTSSVRMRISPLYAISGGWWMRQQIARRARENRKASLMSLMRYLAGVREKAGRPAPAGGDALRTFAWMQRYPAVFRLGFGLSAVTFGLSALVCAGLSWFWPGPWFGLGLATLILVHEMGHFLYGRYARMAPDTPVFWGLMAFVPFVRKRPADGLTHVLSCAAGPFAGALATAALVALYGLTGFGPLLAWALAGAVMNLVGSLLPANGMDSMPLIAAFARWLPIFGVVFGLLLFAGFAAAGYVSPLVPIIGFLAVLTVSQRFRTEHLDLYRSLSSTTRLALGTTTLAMTCYLGAVTFLAVNWL